MLLFVVVQFTTELEFRANFAMHSEGGVTVRSEGWLCPLLLRSRTKSTTAAARHIKNDITNAHTANRWNPTSYVPGLTVDRARDAYRGESKTDARDAHVIGHPRLG